MLITDSQHSESLRSLPSHYFDRFHISQFPIFRPSLHIKNLVRLIKAVSSGPSPGGSAYIQNGKKRAASPTFNTTLTTSKRVKTAFGAVAGVDGADMAGGPETDYDDILDNWPNLQYPFLFHDYLEINDSELIPVYRHVAEIQYTLALSANDADDARAEALGWMQEETILIKLLNMLCGSLSEPRIIDLGKVNFEKFSGRLVASSQLLRESATNLNQWLFIVPSLNQEECNIQWHDFASPAVLDLMKAAHILNCAKRASMHGHLKLVLLPSCACDDVSALPFRLQLETDISLATTSIFDSAVSHSRKEVAEIQDAQRRFLFHLYPAPTTVPACFEGMINVPFFYGILGPAPPLQSKMAQEAMQPDQLLPCLLPFQRRSVGWMLDREGKTVTATGEIVPKTEGTEFSFWDKMEEGNHTWYLHRLTGALSSIAPPQHRVFGGILAEEPGLGKTLEIISLIMLNPAPDRNPSIKRWDPEAKLEVKQIKSTLIITPPALASQWVDELAVHAPTLNVLVYEGWAKVKVPITQSQVEKERIKQLKAKGKGKGKAKATKKAAKSKRKVFINGYTNGKKSTVTADSDEYMDLDEEPEPVEDDEEVMDWCSYVNTFDVVVTTYQVLRHDFNVARPVPSRPRREDVVYSNVESPRSPLVMCEWNRVVMDEVQMVGTGKTEDMVSLIPRLSSFAVSGTPARAQVSDLIHVLKFLRLNDHFGSMRVWNRILKSGYADQFASFFNRYAIRTTKSSVTYELTIPQQTRFLVGIDMGRVERHVYDQALETALQDLGLDARGVAASDGWQVDGALLRSTLRRLRGICTHPQVGQLQKQGDKLYKPGALKTMNDVLQSMRDQNWRNMMDDCKSKVQVLVRCAQLQQHDENDRSRYQHALETLLTAEKEATAMIEDVKACLAAHEAKGEILKKEAAALRETRMQQLHEEQDQPSGKGKEKEQRSLTPVSADEDTEDSDLPRTPAGEEHGIKRRALQQRLRECRVVWHRVKFLQGDVYHVLGVSHSSSENDAYQAAEEIRRDLLKSAEGDAKTAMAQLAQDTKRLEKALTIAVPYLGKGGIRSRDLMEEANEIIDEILNKQSALLWQWRSHISTLLTQKLSSGEDEADGQEYQRTLDNQGEAETYLQVYTALLADRREALVNERTLLAAHDAREKRLRHTKAAIKAAAAANDSQLEMSDDVELQPEHEVLHADLSAERKDLLMQLEGRAIKSVMVDLTAVAARIHKDKDPEKLLVKQAVADLRKLVADQGILMDKLDADLALFRKAFNQRILYFRQLQEISDSVAEVTWDSTIAEAIQKCKAEQTDLTAKINTNRARQRFLDHIAKHRDDGTIDEDEESCILCRCEFNRGFITQCAHVFCEGCMKAWLLRKEGKTCPVCRVAINVDQLQRFSVGQREKEPPPKPVNGEPAPRSRRQITYNRIDSKLFDEIQTMESQGDFGNKIQALVRHLLYLQVTEPGAKSIVFSAWADSLHIMERALINNGIRCLRIDQSRVGGVTKKFRTDPAIGVLLLHGERENAGLNVTCASRVFLLESVVHHGFEIQAIARIDRMGQTRSTEVYCYYTEETIEKNILDLAARRGLSLYTKDNSAGSLNISSFVMDTAKKDVDCPVKKVQKGDFILKIDDMLAILFPHMFEDTEYLLPDDFVTVGDPVEEGDSSLCARASNGRERNVIAGPSRLS